jgi:hypothetical protein
MLWFAIGESPRRATVAGSQRPFPDSPNTSHWIVATDRGWHYDSNECAEHRAFSRYKSDHARALVQAASQRNLGSSLH